jgi:ribosomal-protein-alanine N-acetyltransferase
MTTEHGLRAGGGWSIRRAVETELAQVVLLERETATAPHWAWADYAPLLEGNASAGSLRRCLYVAAEGRVISGFAVGKAVGTGRDVEAELESVVVRPEMRRQGLGSALCRAVIDWARHEGATAIGLEVRAASAGALRLYGGLGFVAVGRRPGYYHDPADDAVAMRCGLGGVHGDPPVRDEEMQPVLF